jgi:hypothetical protein
MADSNLLRKAEIAESVANNMENLSSQLRMMDARVDGAIKQELFPTIEGNTANKLHLNYQTWDGNLIQASDKLSRSAQSLRERARTYRSQYAAQERDDLEREEREKKEREQKQKQEAALVQ